MGRGYGVPTPMAMDLEWYATGAAEPIDDGYRQDGVMHGLIELLGRPDIELAEIPAVRWHRWSTDPDGALDPIALDTAVAHTGLRAPFVFPNGAVIDWVLTPAGWRARRRPT